MKCSVLLCGILLLLSARAVARGKEWSDRSGKFHIEANFVTVKEGKAYLEKSDGQIIGVPLEKAERQKSRLPHVATGSQGLF